MAFILTTWAPDDDTKQGIGVATESGGSWYLVPYEIDSALEANQWVSDNTTQIEADALTEGALVDAAAVTAVLDERGEDTSEIVDGVGDIADLFSHLGHRKALKAIVMLIVDQLNVLRVNDGLSEVTYSQARAAIIQKYKSL